MTSEYEDKANEFFGLELATAVREGLVVRGFNPADSYALEITPELAAQEHEQNLTPGFHIFAEGLPVGIIDLEKTKVSWQNDNQN
jgi:hypothetical protein